MNILAADDERIALKTLTTAICEALPQATVHGFCSGAEALDFGRQNPCQIAFLDIDMGDQTGLSVAKQLKEVNPSINIIFVTAYSEYAIEALSLHVSGYLLKPATKEKVERELQNLRHSVERPSNPGVFIQCFGSFEIFDNDLPLKFYYKKSKELLAYLIDRRGAALTMNELSGILWDTAEAMPKTNSSLRNLISDLTRTLRKAGVDDMIIKRRNQISVDIAKVNCDYYSFLRGNPHSVNSFRGEYMAQYSWAEFTTAALKNDPMIPPAPTAPGSDSQAKSTREEPVPDGK